MKRSIGFLALFLCAVNFINAAKQLKLTSPDSKTIINLKLDQSLSYSLSYQNKLIIDYSRIGLIIENEETTISSLKIVNEEAKKEHIVSPFYRFSSFDVVYKQYDIRCNAKLTVQFRLFENGGVSYRFKSNFKDSLTIKNELAEFNFTKDYTAYTAHTTGKKDRFAMAFQNSYQVNQLSQTDTSLVFLPATVDVEGGWKVTITEADLESYPGMFLQINKGKKGFDGVYAPYPAKVDYYPWRSQEYVTGRASSIAKTKGERVFPWRIISISEKDTEMPVNNLVYALASSNRIGDYKWVKPGKSAWEWWNDWGVWDVDFEAGINMKTYKYYIDFASKYGLEYVILDEGWYDGKVGDMMQVIPDLDLPELLAYAKSKNVGVILWTVFNVLDKQLKEACQHYAQMGVKGFKVDFLDRDDQKAVEMVYRIAEETAKHHLVLDLHGFYKPTGLNRTYPHIVNFESVFGMEEMKWSSPEVNMPLYDVTFPFIRLMAGCVDYTPGAMRNATKKDFQPIYSNPLSQGTRCHQLATYIVFDSPFTMLADSPVLYDQESEYTSFLSSLPVVFEDTKILDGKLGEYIVTARKKDKDWYIGGMTNWNARELEVDFSFLEKDSNYKLTLYKDGVNANKQASDYDVETLVVNKESKIKIPMASGGGFVMKVEIQ